MKQDEDVMKVEFGWMIAVKSCV